MTDDRGLDPLRLAESAAQAALVLALVALPVAWRVLDARLVTVLAAMLIILSLATYALHAVTFDCFRLTGQRSRRSLSYTQRED